MTDIAMCTSSKCLKKNECYRFMAVPDSELQYYIDFEAINCHEDNKWFYEIEHRKIREIEKVEKIESLGE